MRKLWTQDIHHTEIVQTSLKSSGTYEVSLVKLEIFSRMGTDVSSFQETINIGKYSAVNNVTLISRGGRGTPVSPTLKVGDAPRAAWGSKSRVLVRLSVLNIRQ